MGYKNPLFFQLVFDYNINKLEKAGRFWAKDGYGNCDKIFEYSVASAVTFLNSNSHLPFRIYTDNIDLYMSKLNTYDVSLDNFDIVDISKELDVWKQHKYCFNPAMKIVQYHKDTDYDIIFMDNDLSFKERRFDDYLIWDGMLQGHKEHFVEHANPLWGEIHACQNSIGKTDFWVYDKNILGFTNKILKDIADEGVEVQDMMADVDISSVTDVPGHGNDPEIIYHCCEQTAWSYLIDKYNIPVLETKDTYHQYYEDKYSVINDAQRFKKES